jgi:hypothetical protein
MSTNRLDRRQFLIASSACALVTATVGPNVFAAAGAAPRRLAVGFAPINDTATVISAGAIPAGDGAFISRGARILVSGVSGMSAEPVERRAVELHAHYDYFDGSERKVAPFVAWGCSRATGAQGSPVSFTMPVDETQRVAFSVETERGIPRSMASRRDVLSGETPESVVLPMALTLKSGDGLKLARGYYVIVPLFDADTEPRWSNFRLQTSDGRWRLDQGDEAAPFEHFVLRIDYAS